MEYETNDLQASYPDKFVCAACFGDHYLQGFIDSCVETRTCNYCGRRNRTMDIAAPVDTVIQHIFECLCRHYGEAWASGASWDKETDQYMNETWDSDDLLQEYLELANDQSDELYEDILNAFPYWDWTRASPWSATDSQILKWGWDRFVNVVKYQRRFFFARHEKPDELDRDDLTPGALLDVIGTRCADNGLIETISPGTQILRCRPRASKAERFTKARELGAPPSKLAKKNRMSPAGISMFYGADEKATTLGEMPEVPRFYAIGRFETLRPLRLLDLTHVKQPSIFNDGEFDDYHWLVFLQDFLADFTKPLKRDDSIHIEYVPTQVVTEYLRDTKLVADVPVDGIKYISARRRGGICYVLFMDRYSVEPLPGELNGEEVEHERWRMPQGGYVLRLSSIRHYG